MLPFTPMDEQEQIDRLQLCGKAGATNISRSSLPLTKCDMKLVIRNWMSGVIQSYSLVLKSSQK